jgi:hypothetical protein
MIKHLSYTSHSQATSAAAPKSHLGTKIFIGRDLGRRTCLELLQLHGTGEQPRQS